MEYSNWFKEQGININMLSDGNIKSLMNKFKLTWHEHQNGHLVQLVSSNLHSVKYGGFSHLGGISILKKIEEARKIATTLNQITRGG